MEDSDEQLLTEFLDGADLTEEQLQNLQMKICDGLAKHQGDLLRFYEQVEYKVRKQPHNCKLTIHPAHKYALPLIKALTSYNVPGLLHSALRVELLKINIHDAYEHLKFKNKSHLKEDLNELF